MESIIYAQRVREYNAEFRRPDRGGAAVKESPKKFMQLSYAMSRTGPARNKRMQAIYRQVNEVTKNVNEAKKADLSQNMAAYLQASQRIYQEVAQVLSLMVGWIASGKSNQIDSNDEIKEKVNKIVN